MLNLADKLTLSRVLAAPITAALLVNPSRISCRIAMFVFIAGALTDILDGWAARRYNLVSNFGKFLDPVADKVLVLTALIMVVGLGWAPGWVAAVITAREIVVTGLRAAAVERGVVIAADKFGKMKTLTQVVALSCIMLHWPLFGINPRPLGDVFLYTALVLTVLSGANYVRAAMTALAAEKGAESGRHA